MYCCCISHTYFKVTFINHVLLKLLFTYRKTLRKILKIWTTKNRVFNFKCHQLLLNANVVGWMFRNLHVFKTLMKVAMKFDLRWTNHMKIIVKLKSFSLGWRMFRMWDVKDVGFSGCEMFKLWNVWDVECSKFGSFGMWDVWDVRFLQNKDYFNESLSLAKMW